MEPYDDQQLIGVVLAGDVNAYSVLVERYQRPIFNLMYRMTGSYEDARDLAQETFIKAYERLDSFKIGKRFFPWLYTIGFNHASNFLRRSKSSRTNSNDDWGQGSILDSPEQQEERLCSQLDSMRLQEALKQLPLDYREAVILYYHEELSMQEIANAFGLSISGAKMRVHRGLNKLRTILLGDDHERERLVSTKG